MKIKIIKNENLRLVGEDARKNIEEKFNSKKMSKAYQEIYEGMIMDVSKVTLFISCLSGGGAERVTCNLANYLYGHGCPVDVITMSNANDSYKLDDGIARICLLDEKERRLGKMRNFLIRQRRLKEYVRKNQDISCYVVMLPATIFMLIRLKKYTSAKIIISERNNPSSYGLMEKIMMRYSAKRCDGLVVQTKEIGKWYKNIRNKIVIPNALNEDIELPRRKNIEKRVVAVGRLEKQKNYPMMINAFQIINEKYPDHKLEIYGYGSQEKLLKKMIKKYKLNDCVLFKGYVKNISNEIVDAACFLMTSNYEGISNALIEAMCMGIPCVATDCDGGGARELIQNGINGFLIEKGSIDGLINKVESLIESEDLSKKISNNAIKMRQTLSPRVIYGRWFEYIKKNGGWC